MREWCPGDGCPLKRDCYRYLPYSVWHGDEQVPGSYRKGEWNCSFLVPQGGGDEGGDELQGLEGGQR